MKQYCFIITLFIFSINNVHSQTYSSIISDTDIIDVLSFEMNINNIKKIKKVYINPISWKKIDRAIFDFEIQIIDHIVKGNGFKYNLFKDGDIEYFRKQYNSEFNQPWNFELLKGKFKNNPRQNYFSYTIPLFDKTHTRAIVYFEYKCKVSLNCSYGGILVYTKKNNNWEFLTSTGNWTE